MVVGEGRVDLAASFGPGRKMGRDVVVIFCRGPLALIVRVSWATL